MKKFLVLYRSTVSSREQMSKATPEQAKAGMDAWIGWAKRTGTALVDMGNPLGETGVVHGSAVPGYIGGYSVVQAETLEAAKRLFEGHPHLGAPSASIELLEMLPLPGM
jgi:hypothetical protein